MDGGGGPPNLWSVDVGALARRVERLEMRGRDSRPSAGDPPARDDDPAAGTAGSSGARTATGTGAAGVRTAEVMRSLVRLSPPAYLAVSLTRAEEMEFLRDVALQAGEVVAAREMEDGLAGVVCDALDRVVDDVDMGPFLAEPDPNGLLRGTAPHPEWDAGRFREQELHVLRLAGLSDDLAAKHLDAAFASFLADTSVQIRDASDARNALTRASDAAAAARDSLVRDRAKADARRRRRKILRRCVLALGGATIAVANTLATPLIGPVAVTASVALGSGAAGAIANLIED